MPLLENGVANTGAGQSGASGILPRQRTTGISSVVRGTVARLIKNAAAQGVLRVNGSGQRAAVKS